MRQKIGFSTSMDRVIFFLITDTISPCGRKTAGAAYEDTWSSQNADVA